MDPLFDEKLILTVMRNFTDFIEQSLYLSAEKEAYGPSRNEGLCYESCQRIDFSGEIEGHLYLGLDGYTKFKLLPRIAERYKIENFESSMANSVLLEFTNQLGARILTELVEGGYRIALSPPEILNHKLVSFDLKRHRQYIIIFFLKDRRQKTYLGRAYLTLLLKKY